MEKLGESPFVRLGFDEEGGTTDTGALLAFRALAATPGITDVVVVSHGWKNNPADAKRLYAELWHHVVSSLKQRRASSIGVCGVLWPAKKYGNDLDFAALAQVNEGGSSADGGGIADLDQALFDRIMAEFAAFVGLGARGVISAAGRVGLEGPQNGRDFDLVEEASRFVSAGQTDPELRADTAPITSTQDPRRLILGLAEPPRRRVTSDVGGAQGIRDVFGKVFHGPKAAVVRLLNQLTYYEMKRRAGVIGTALGASVLPQLQPVTGAPTRLHLVGHSFGARLVSAAVNAYPRGAPLELFSLTLLQGAFSHNAFAELLRPGLRGAFPNVVGHTTGPIAITHTHNDLACTLAYALASRLSWDTASGIGDRDDVFGAIGANGAQLLKPSRLAAVHSSGPFNPIRGKVNHFLADDYIVKTTALDAHNNVANARTGEMLASVIEA